MKKFLLGIFAGLVLAFLAAIVVVFSLISFGERRPHIAHDSTLILRLSGDLPEKSPVAVPVPFIGAPTPLTVQEVWEGLRRARTDSRIKALVLLVGNVDAGWAKVSEIRSNLQEFRKSGKPVYAYLRAPHTRDYYLASVAERVYVAPEDMVDLKGLRAEVMYFKDALSKIGVEVQVQHVGKYKDAGDMFTKTAMSPETRESLNLLLDGVFDQVVTAIAKARNRTPLEIRTLIDEGPYTAQQAASRGVVDALRYEDQLYGEIKDRLKQGELKKLSFRDYIRGLGPEPYAKKRIAFIVGEGAIVRGSGNDAMGTDEGFSSGSYIRMLRSVIDDSSVSGIILRIDSPGGDAFASDEILREIRLLRARKPTVISMSDAAASGGYYIAMTGDPVIAYPQTITGSIGVLFGKVNLKGLYDKLGIQKEILTRGRHAAIDSDYGPLSPEARQKLQDGLEEFYRGFVTKVAQSRNRPYQDVDALAQGRVWLGMHAKERGLVDELGGIDRAVELIRQKLNLKPDEAVRLVPYPAKRNLLEQWLKSATEPASAGAYLRAVTGMDVSAWLKGGILRIMPFSLDIR
jgi:protease-4